MSILVTEVVLPLTTPLAEAVELALSDAMDTLYHNKPTAKVLSHGIHIAPFDTDNRCYVTSVVYR